MTTDEETIDGPAGPYAYRRLGSGPPLLLINGYAAAAADWDPAFLEALAAERTVICPDHRGMGGSAPGDDDVTVESMAADALHLLDELGIGRAPVAGWSMGGFVAQAVARAAPDRVERLVLMGTDSGGAAAVHCTADVWTRLTDHSGTPAEQASRLISLLFPPEVAAVVEREFGDVVAASRASLSPAAVARQQAAMIGWATRAEQRALTVPVLAAHGSEDVIIPAANAEKLARGPGDWLARFDGGGHAFMAQEPRRVAALIHAWLARV